MALMTNGKQYLSGTQISNIKRSRKKYLDFDETKWYAYPLPNRFREWRESNSFTTYMIVQTLSKYGFSFTIQYINDVDADKISPSRDFMYALKKAFNVSIDKMFFED